MRLTLLTPPALPLTLDDVKAYCRIIGDDEDMTLETLIKTAVSVFETLTSRQISPAEYEAELTNEISVTLPKSPIITISSVKNEAGEELPADKYSVAFDYDVAKIVFTESFSGKITFSAGYTNVPDDILGWLRARIAAIYENREERFKTFEEYIVNTYKVSYFS